MKNIQYVLLALCYIWLGCSQRSTERNESSGKEDNIDFSSDTIKFDFAEGFLKRSRLTAPIILRNRDWVRQSDFQKRMLSLS